MDSDFAMSIAICGDRSVGKTSLLSRNVENKFDPKQGPSVGIDSSSIKLERDGTVLAIKFIDTAGREKFRPVPAAYLPSAVGE